MNQYHIYDQIGKGRHSVVYKGRKKQTVKYYAIKRVEKSEKPRVLQEVRTFHNLNHENVLKFHEWYETSNHLWLILEYCVGGDLLALLKQDARLPEESVHDFGWDCAQALQFLHANGIIYADLKPSNILLDENGRPKLCDFGLSRKLSDISNTSEVHLPHSKRGTPCYMAPELLEEEGVHSFSSDLWSLGCVMFECYCGRPPFAAPTLAGLFSALFTEDPPPLPGNPSPEFQDILSRLLQKDPAKRITWEELRKHPFWRAPIKPLQLAPQPAFEFFLRKRAMLSASMSKGQALEQDAQHQGGDVADGTGLGGPSRLGHASGSRPMGGARGASNARTGADARVALVDVRSTEVNAQGGSGRGAVAANADMAGARDAQAAGLAVGGAGPVKPRPAGADGGHGGASGSWGTTHEPQNAGQGHAQAMGQASSNPSRAGAGGVQQPGVSAAANALRLSRIVRTNLEKEAEADGEVLAYRQGTYSGTASPLATSLAANEDVLLENNDVELDFEERTSAQLEQAFENAVQNPEHTDNREHAEKELEEAEDEAEMDGEVVDPAPDGEVEAYMALEGAGPAAAETFVEEKVAGPEEMGEPAVYPHHELQQQQYEEEVPGAEHEFLENVEPREGAVEVEAGMSEAPSAISTEGPASLASSEHIELDFTSSIAPSDVGASVDAPAPAPAPVAAQSSAAASKPASASPAATRKAGPGTCSPGGSPGAVLPAGTSSKTVASAAAGSSRLQKVHAGGEGTLRRAGSGSATSARPTSSLSRGAAARDGAIPRGASAGREKEGTEVQRTSSRGKDRGAKEHASPQQQAPRQQHLPQPDISRAGAASCEPEKESSAHPAAPLPPPATGHADVPLPSSPAVAAPTHGASTSGGAPAAARDEAAGAGLGVVGSEVAAASLGVLDGERHAVEDMWHSSDFVVRPIVLNRRIERPVDPTFDSRHLPCNPCSPTIFAQLPAQDRASMITALSSRISGKTGTVSERLNCIQYVQTLAFNTDAANQIIASPLMTTLVRSLCTSKTPLSRVELCTALGLLVRHATHIPDELAGSGIVNVLTEILRDKQEKVRRKAMAALGELLFYIATQMPQPSPASQGASGQGSQPGWHVPAATFNLIAAMLQKGEDEITQHYAVKTIENVAGEGPAWASRFASQQLVGNLCRIFKTANSKLEHLKASAGACLMRLLRSLPSLGGSVLEAMGPPREFMLSLQKAGQKDQQVMLNILNVMLLAACPADGTSNSGSANGNAPGGGGASGQSRQAAASSLPALLEERSLVPVLIGLLETTPVIKGKALVALGLLCRYQPWRWIPVLCPVGPAQAGREPRGSILPVLERLSKEKEEYVVRCLDVLVSNIASSVPMLIDHIATGISSVACFTVGLQSPGATPGPGRPAGRNAPAQQHQVAPQTKKVLDELEVLLKLLSSNLLRPRIVNGNLISSIAEFIGHSYSPFLQGEEALQAALLQAVVALCEQRQQLLQYMPEVRGRLLPALAGLYSKALAGEMRFLAFQEICDLISILLGDTSAAKKPGTDEGGEGLAESEGEVAVREFVEQLLLPLLPKLMADDETLLPKYAQKLLVNLSDRRLINVAEVLQNLKLTGRCFELLLESPDFTGVHMHALSLCIILAGAPQVTLHNTTELRVFSRLGALLKHVVTAQLQDFVDPVVSLCFLVLEGHLEKVEAEEGIPGESTFAAGDSSKGAARASFAVRKGGWGGREEKRGEEEEKVSQEMILAEINEMAQFSAEFLQLSCRNVQVVAAIATDCLHRLLHTTPVPVLQAVKENIDVVTVALSTCGARLPTSFAIGKQLLLLMECITQVCKEELSRRFNGNGNGMTNMLLSPLTMTGLRQPTSKVCCWTKAQLSGLREAIGGLRDGALQDMERAGYQDANEKAQIDRLQEDIEKAIRETLTKIEALQQDGIFNA